MSKNKATSTICKSEYFYPQTRLRGQFTRSPWWIKPNFSKFLIFQGILTTLLLIPGQALTNQASQFENRPGSVRFVKLDTKGRILTESPETKSWACVLDKTTGLIWEIKTRDGSFQDQSHSYSWYLPDKKRNGGSAGYRNKGQCPLNECNTQSYVDTINNRKLCNISRWRLPTREELRSIVDYQIKYPGPVINQNYFPNTLGQFYWSSVPDANDKDSAWGIGFSFGYDYAYFKSDFGYVRVVTESAR